MEGPKKGGSRITNVYECTICGEIVMQLGLSNHMKHKHGLDSTWYGPSEITAQEQRTREPDLIILYEHVPRGKAKDTYWRQHQVIAKWVFSVGGKNNLQFKKGSRLHFRLWLPSRIRRLNKKQGRKIREHRYLEDFFK